MHGDIVEIRTHYPPLLHQSHTDGVDTVLAVAGPAARRRATYQTHARALSDAFLVSRKILNGAAIRQNTCSPSWIRPIIRQHRRCAPQHPRRMIDDVLNLDLLFYLGMSSSGHRTMKTSSRNSTLASPSLDRTTSASPNDAIAR